MTKELYIEFFGKMYLLTRDEIFKNLRTVTEEYDNFNFDCFSWGQLKSKEWLIDELKKLNINLGTVFLCAGWYGTLADMIFKNLKVDHIRSFDISQEASCIADKINKHYLLDGWKFKSSIYDIHDITYPFTYYTTRNDNSLEELWDNPDTIINTSCEHIENYDKWVDKIPNNKFVILQSNNYFSHDQHINCVHDLDEFKKQTKLNNILYQGELDLEKYKRFMIIGYK